MLRFMTQNFLITSMGFVAGSVLTCGLNLWLMHQFHEPMLPLIDVLVGSLILVSLGQVAVLSPAISASHVPPATAARVA